MIVTECNIIWSQDLLSKRTYVLPENEDMVCEENSASGVSINQKSRCGKERGRARNAFHLQSRALLKGSIPAARGGPLRICQGKMPPSGKKNISDP